MSCSSLMCREKLNFPLVTFLVIAIRESTINALQKIYLPLKIIILWVVSRNCLFSHFPDLCYFKISFDITIFSDYLIIRTISGDFARFSLSSPISINSEF